LYLYVFPKIDKELFYEKMDSIIYDENVKFYKYFKKELDKMNWVITLKTISEN
jgi:hypothetical protein